MASTTTRRRRHERFEIHEDAISTDRAMATDEMMQEDEEEEDYEDDADEPPSPSPSPSSDESEDERVDKTVQEDMDRLQDTFPGFRRSYKLIKRIGEGTFSTVYKAEDLRYDVYENEWDADRETAKWTVPPLRHSHSSQSSRTLDQESQSRRGGREGRKPKYVAVKKIYVTSSPARIHNELELLHDLRDCEAVCPLITAFRSADQVVAILPYFRHANFQEYFRDMSARDMAIYLRVLFTALSAVHAKGILHRDIKPTNFLYDATTRHGVLVDFGLAEREGADAKPCLCRESRQVRQQRLHAAYAAYTPVGGYPKNDTRPTRRANRAGTRGFRAPEVLFKCTEQSTKLDVWSAGVILLTILTRRFPFFNSADDVDATIEMATVFGVKRMRVAAQLHGAMFETNIPTIPQSGFALERIILWSTCRAENEKPLTPDEKLAVSFLRECLELDPAKRQSAEAALHHDFLKLGLDEVPDSDEDDEMDMLQA